jgi:DNA-binding transcriptional regulator GbsR (MarR family)
VIVLQKGDNMRISQAVTKIKAAFMQHEKPLTISDIRQLHAELKASQISASLCYLIRARWVTRDQIESNFKRGHKMVYRYTFHKERLPKNAISPE